MNVGMEFQVNNLKNPNTIIYTMYICIYIYTVAVGSNNPTLFFCRIEYAHEIILIFSLVQLKKDINSFR